MSDTAPSTPESAAPLLPRVPPRPMAEAPALIFYGCVSLWLGLRVFVSAGFVMLLGLACIICGVWEIGAPYHLGSGLAIVGAALCLSCGLMLLYMILSIRSRRYKIDTRLIEREQGLLVKRVDSLDLARVKDVELSQSLMQRALNIGTIAVFSTDRLNPLLVIEALPNPRPIYEKLRDAVIAVAQKRGVIPMN